MTDWRSLLHKDKTLRGYEDIKEEFMAALTTEFGIEFNDEAYGIDADLANALIDVNCEISVYTRDWILHLLGEARPEIGFGVSREDLDAHIENIAEEILHLHDKGYSVGDTVEDAARVKPQIAVAESESVNDVAKRVKHCFEQVEAHLLPPTQSPSL